jgi:hypothetical protein
LQFSAISAEWLIATAVAEGQALRDIAAVPDAAYHDQVDLVDESDILQRAWPPGSRPSADAGLSVRYAAWPPCRPSAPSR